MSSKPTLDATPYSVMKWTVQIVLPSIATLYFALASTWNLPFSGEIVATITAFTTFLGVVLGVSTYNYHHSDEKYDGVMKIHEGAGKDVYSLELGGDPEGLPTKKEIVFKVQNEPGAQN